MEYALQWWCLWELTASVSVFQTWAECPMWNNFSLPTRTLGCRRGALAPSGGCHIGGYELSSWQSGKPPIWASLLSCHSLMDKIELYVRKMNCTGIRWHYIQSYNENRTIKYMVMHSRLLQNTMKKKIYIYVGYIVWKKNIIIWIKLIRLPPKVFGHLRSNIW